MKEGSKRQVEFFWLDPVHLYLTPEAVSRGFFYDG